MKLKKISVRELIETLTDDEMKNVIGSGGGYNGNGTCCFTCWFTCEDIPNVVNGIKGVGPCDWDYYDNMCTCGFTYQPQPC